MRKALSILLCLVTISLFCGCNTTKESETTATVADRTVTLINSVNEASIWVLPDTEANRKTTLWGTATASNLQAGSSCQAGIGKPGDNGLYLFRMIDSDKMYYSSDNILLEDGWMLEIKGDLKTGIVIEVTDKDGALNATYEVFAARL